MIKNNISRQGYEMKRLAVFHFKIRNSVCYKNNESILRQQQVFISPSRTFPMCKQQQDHHGFVACCRSCSFRIYEQRRESELGIDLHSRCKESKPSCFGRLQALVFLQSAECSCVRTVPIPV